jgi:hypothetical protein
MESHGGIILPGEKPKNSKKNLTQGYFIHYKYHME